MGSYGVAAAGAQLLQQGAERAHHRGGRLSRGAAQGAQQLSSRSARPRRRRSGATGSSTRWPTMGYITAEQAKAAKAKPLKVNIRPIGTQIYAADYFAEDVRRTLVASFGEDGLYGRAERAAAGDGRINGGLSVRTTLDPNLQRMARRALVDGLVTFDREKGWRGAARRRSTSAATGARRSTGIETPSDLAPWRLGVVLEAQTHQGRRRPATRRARPTAASRQSARRSRSPSTRSSGRARPRRAEGRHRRAERRRRDLGRAQGPDQADGRVVADADPRGRRRPRRHGPAHGPRARRGRRLLASPPASSTAPCRPSASRAPPSSRSSTPPRSTTATSRPASCSTRRSRSTRGRARRSGNPKNYDGASAFGPSTLRARHREVAQPDDGAAGPGHGHAADRRVLQALRRLRRPAAGARHVARRRRDHAARACAPPTRRSPTAASRCSRP